MGYRFVLRKFTFPSVVSSPGVLDITSWWENKGVAPSYRRFPLALRFSGPQFKQTLVTAADITSWLPGDNLYDDRIVVPANIPTGEYDLQLALLDPNSGEPRVSLAIEGKQTDGWYALGIVRVQR